MSEFSKNWANWAKWANWANFLASILLGKLWLETDFDAITKQNLRLFNKIDNIIIYWTLLLLLVGIEPYDSSVEAMKHKEEPITLSIKTEKEDIAIKGEPTTVCMIIYWTLLLLLLLAGIEPYWLMIAQ